ncbi:exodeoxyribonuclease VII large subunit [Anaerolineales bacterium]
MQDSLSVHELNQYIATLINNDDVLNDVWVRGELSNFSQAHSGHWYMTIKDASSQIGIAMWKSYVARQSFVPAQGDEIFVRGRLEVYEPRGEYKLIATEIRSGGRTGDLYAQFEAIKRRLSEEGLFDIERKRRLPVFPLRIGVVTSPDAAAFRDVQNVLGRRFPLARIVLSGTLVQGDAAPLQIIQAIQRLNNYGRVDAIILCRGGGSIEDLWAFNDEGVARAISNSQIPIIAGVGHETDFTIADFVADLRAPTPSAAAELLTPDRQELVEDIGLLFGRMLGQFLNTLEQSQSNLGHLQQRLDVRSPATELKRKHLEVDQLYQRMDYMQRHYFNRQAERLESLTQVLANQNPETILGRGFAIVRDQQGIAVSSVDRLNQGDKATLTFRDGEMSVTIESKRRADQDDQ